MINFCTLFNSTYLTRGLAMYHSLEEHCADFHLYILAFDQQCYDTLVFLRLSHATVISLQEFEDEQLLSVKSTRTATEYCWTCTPASIQYCMQKFQLDSCTYIDADLLFFSDPKILIEEMGEDSVLITEHRYTPQYDQTQVSGKYCVQFVCIKNDERGRKVLQWWKDACLEWCYNRVEDNKFGDQKYLDDWCERFEGVHELRHLGGGLAPWNMQQYDFALQNDGLTGTETSTGKKFNAVFFHFHCFRYFKTSVFAPAGNYQLNENLLSLIYDPYIKSLQRAENLLTKSRQFHGGKAHESLPLKKVFHSPVRIYLLYMRGNFKHYYHESYFQKRRQKQPDYRIGV